jgi:hypothetical protein
MGGNASWIEANYFSINCIFVFFVQVNPNMIMELERVGLAFVGKDERLEREWRYYYIKSSDGRGEKSEFIFYFLLFVDFLSSMYNNFLTPLTIYAESKKCIGILSLGNIIRKRYIESNKHTSCHLL